MIEERGDDRQEERCPRSQPPTSAIAFSARVDCAPGPGA